MLIQKIYQLIVGAQEDRPDPQDVQGAGRGAAGGP